MSKRQPMPAQDPKERIRNFGEVALGYTPQTAVLEAKRCMGCKKPECMDGCPVGIDIPGFIAQIAEKNFGEAYEILRQKNNLPAICGRVCPQETQCEILCVMGKKQAPVAIGRLERFAADWYIHNSSKFKVQDLKSTKENQKPSTSNLKSSTKRVAVLGSGPAGLTCAADLANMGYKVTVFESLHAPGGVLRYGIPEFRLPKRVVDIEIGYIKDLGVEVQVNMVIGKIETIAEFREDGFRAFFIGTGAGLPHFLGIQGENLNGVYSANEFLTRSNLMKAYRFPDYDTPIKVGKTAAVIGAGNVAVDSARVAKRLGAEEVYIVYRRSEGEMPARLEEINRAKEEGIKFELLRNPTQIFGDEKGWVREMECIRNRLGAPDESGRRRPVPIEGSEFKFDCQTVVVAIGQGPNPLLLEATPDLKLTEDGRIETDPEGHTSIPDVFAGGDIVTGAATVIEAMGAGKIAARSIDRYLMGKQ